jgi:hypothetical protein
MRKFTFILAAVLLIGASHAQTVPGDLETDRPDQTETPYLVPKNYFQAENGFSRTREAKGLYVNTTVSLLRYAVSRNFELRSELVYDITDEKNNLITKGFAAPEIGFKLRLCEEKKWMPKTSLIAHLAIPGAASKAYRGRYVMPNFRFVMQHTLSKKQSFSYNLGGEWSTDDKRFTALYTIASGYDLSNRWYGYIELFGHLPVNGRPQHSADIGFAWLMKPNIQLDISGGPGISKDAPDYYVAVGLSFRLPK